MIEWDLASGRATRSVDLGWRKTALRHACSADGHWCASSDFARTDVLEVDTWRVDRSFPVGAIGLALTSDGTMIAAAGHFEVVIMNRRDGSRREFKGHRDQVATVAFSADDRLLASAAAGEVMVWDVSTGRELSAFHSGQRSVRCLAFSRDGRTLATAGDEVVRVWDPRTGQRRHVLEGHTNQVTGLAFSADGRFLVSGSVDGTTRIWDVERGTEVALLAVRKDSEDWVVITPDGIFDGSARGTETLVAWRVGMTMYPAERYFGQFFTPGLLAAIWRDAIPSGHSTIAGVPVPPALRILQGSGAVVKTPRMSLQVDVDGAATEVSLYHNGSRVASQPGTDTAAQYVFELDLVPGDNELRAVAVGEADVASNPETIRVTYDVPEPHRPSLYLLTIGVSRYRGPNWNLGFARDDAQALSEFFTNRAQKLFAKVDVNVLVDEQATRANILEAVASIGQRSRPEDVVLIYFAGHGLSIEQTYYLLPHEMRDETSLANDVRQFGVSDRLLLDSLRKIKALKRVLILDACGAAAATALEILARGPAAERAALEMLARAEGIFIIAASTPQQEALEIPELGHGVLTYAILRGLGAWGNPAEREVVTMHQLLSYISQKVPELAAQYGRRTRQVPVTFHRGMDFPLIVH
jgi:WD40 repeat protein